MAANFSTSLSPFVTLSNNNQTVAGSGGNGTAISNSYIAAGEKIYFRVSIGQYSSNVRIGLARRGSNAAASLGSGLDDHLGYWASSGGVVRGAGNVGTAEAYTTGDVIHVAVDYNNDRAWFKK